MTKRNSGAVGILFYASHKEKKLLEAFCQQEDRNQTEVLREFMRGLEAKLVKQEG